MVSGLASDSPEDRGAQNQRQDHAENEDPEENLRNRGEPGGDSAKPEYPEYHRKDSTDNRPLQHSDWMDVGLTIRVVQNRVQLPLGRPLREYLSQHPAAPLEM
jgi:hypothetical protein